MGQIKDYLGFENARNKLHAEVYTRLIKEAFGGDQCSVLVGHHLAFELKGDINTENEIPSADTLLFDHQVMKIVFGEADYRFAMRQLASAPAEERDQVLRDLLAERDRARARKEASGFQPAAPQTV